MLVQFVFKEFLPVFRLGLMLAEGSKVGGANAYGNQVLLVGKKSRYCYSFK